MDGRFSGAQVHDQRLRSPALRARLCGTSPREWDGWRTTGCFAFLSNRAKRRMIPWCRVPDRFMTSLLECDAAALSGLDGMSQRRSLETLVFHILGERYGNAQGIGQHTVKPACRNVDSVSRNQRCPVARTLHRQWPSFSNNLRNPVPEAGLRVVRHKMRLRIHVQEAVIIWRRKDDGFFTAHLNQQSINSIEVKTSGTCSNPEVRTEVRSPEARPYGLRVLR